MTRWTPKSDCAIYERSLIGNNLEHKAGTVSVNRTEGVIGLWMYCIGGHGDKTEIIGAWVGTHALSILTVDRAHVTARCTSLHPQMKKK